MQPLRRGPTLGPYLVAALLTFPGARAHVDQSTTYYGDCSRPGVGISDDVGTIYSPKYGMTNGTHNTYPISCSLLVGIDASSPIQVIFNDFNVSRGDYCKITDLITSNAYTFTGSAIPILPLLSKSLSVRFYSNGDNQTGRGFVLRWTTDYASLPTTTLPPISADATYISIDQTASTDIFSPNFPSLYPFSCVKDWVITGPETSQIVLNFRYFYTEDTHDHLKILDGYDLGSEVLIGDYSGDLRSHLPSPVVSSTPRLHVRFLTDDTIRFTGFNVHASIYDPNAVATTAAPTTTTAKTTSTNAPSGLLDPVATICLAVVLPLIVVSAVIAGIVYVAWYQPRKLKYARQEAIKHYAAMKEEYEKSASEGRPGSARPGSARPGSARPGSARPGSARPGTARPGTALYGPRPGTARQTLETVAEGPTASAARPASALRTTAADVHRPMSASQRQAVIARLPTEQDERPPSVGSEGSLLVTPGTQRHPYQSLGDGPDDVGGVHYEPAPSIASLVGTKRSARIKAPPQIFINDGFVEDGSDDWTHDAQRELRGGSRAPPAPGALPPLSDGARRLPPLSRAGQGLLSPSLATAFQAAPQPSRLPTTLGGMMSQQQQQQQQQQLQQQQQQLQQQSLAPQPTLPAASPLPQRAPAAVAQPAAAADHLSPTGTGHSNSADGGAPLQRPTSPSGLPRPGSASANQRPASATRNSLPSAPFYEDDDDDALSDV